MASGSQASGSLYVTDKCMRKFLTIQAVNLVELIYFMGVSLIVFSNLILKRLLSPEASVFRVAFRESAGCIH